MRPGGEIELVAQPGERIVRCRGRGTVRFMTGSAVDRGRCGCNSACSMLRASSFTSRRLSSRARTRRRARTRKIIDHRDLDVLECTERSVSGLRCQDGSHEIEAAEEGVLSGRRCDTEMNQARSHSVLRRVTDDHQKRPAGSAEGCEQEGERQQSGAARRSRRRGAGPDSEAPPRDRRLGERRRAAG